MCGRGIKKPRALAQLDSTSDDKSKLAKTFFSDDDDDDDDDDNDNDSDNNDNGDDEDGLDC